MSALAEDPPPWEGRLFDAMWRDPRYWVEVIYIISAIAQIVVVF